MTSIGRVGDAYIQNVKELDQYNALISAGKLPVHKGVDLDEDDKIRRQVITNLICHFELDFKTIEQQFNVDFAVYFASELASLGDMQKDGLLKLSNTSIQVEVAGRLLIRNICMVFDKYLAQQQQQFSKVI